MKIGAHRGASGHAPENTLAAFALALEAGADLLEFDVQLSRDRIPVVIHDAWVNRTSDGHGRVTDLTWEELRRLDFGSYLGKEFAGCRIPSLDEVLELGAGRCQLNIEIKNGPIYYPGIEKLIMAKIADHDCREQVVVSSFDHRALYRCRQIDPEVKLAYLIAHLPLEVETLLPPYPLYALHPHYAYVDRESVEECHRLGLAVQAWGTNDPVDWRHLAQWGADCIITDYVTELRECLRTLAG